MLVSLSDARRHLRIDDEYDDPWLNLMIDAVSQAVLLWLKDEWRAYVPLRDSSGEIVYDSNGDIVPTADVKPVVQAAVLVELASQYRFREGEGAAQVPAHWGHGYTLSVGATSLLTPLRKSTVA